MTPGSNPTVSTKGFERRRLYGNQKPRSEKIFSGSKDQKNPKSPSSRNRLNCFLKDPARMEPRDKHRRSSQAALNHGKLRELASKWFIETQVPNIVHNGLFPNWFLGFITREDAEEILREREPGCFLVRLSHKAIGYILSYKGKDRCRHFVINQNEDGQFTVSGDNGGHDTVPKLIEFYMSSPFEPFGEFLTSSCSEVLNEDLYDTVQICPKENPVSSVRTAMNAPKQRIDLPSEQPSTHPSPREGAPPPPQRIRHLDTGPVHSQDRVLYAQIRKQPSRDKLRPQHVFQGHLPGHHQDRPERPAAQNQTVIQLTPPSGRGSSPESCSSDGKHCHRRRTPPDTPPKVSPKPVRDATRSHPQPDPRGPHHALYHLAGESYGPHPAASVPGSLTPEQSGEPLYAELPGVALVGHLSGDNNYEPLPVHEDPAHPKTSTNTYEPAEDLKAKALKNYIRKWAKWKW